MSLLKLVEENSTFNNSFFLNRNHRVSWPGLNLWTKKALSFTFFRSPKPLAKMLCKISALKVCFLLLLSHRSSGRWWGLANFAYLCYGNCGSLRLGFGSSGS